ncbi:MAG: biotin transporter BioY [Elainellaceae cyanobacterium]
MTTRDIVYIAVFAALIAALGLLPPIPLPFIPVPITAQSLGVMLAGSFLGAKRGGLAMLLFLGLVAIGLPILAGGRGGFGVFLSPSGGFLLAFPIAAFVIGWLFERSPQQTNLGLAILFNLIGGIGVIYLIGIPWLAIATQISLAEAAIGSAAFIPGDVIKVVIAAIATVTVQKTYPLLRT